MDDALKVLERYLALAEAAAEYARDKQSWYVVASFRGIARVLGQVIQEIEEAKTKDVIESENES